MWRRGGRSSALDRAQGLLAAKSGGGAGTQAHAQGSVQGSISSRSFGPSLSDLSENSSVSLTAEPEPSRSADSGETHGAEVDLRRPSSPLGGRSRFLKKPPPTTNSIQSQERLEPRCVPSSQRSSQAAALSRLAAIENRVRVRKQAQGKARQGSKSANTPTPDTSPAAAGAAANRSPVASELSTPSPSGDHRLKGSHFLKKKDSGAAGAAASESADLSVRFRTEEPAAPWWHVKREPVKVVTAVSLESDEEDMKRLLGESPDSSYRLSPVGLESSIKKQDEISSRSKKVNSTLPPAPLPAAASQLPSSPHCSLSSPPRQAQVCFSPTVLSPSPSPPPTERPGSSHSFSLASDHEAVLSLEELFPLTPQRDEPHSDVSSVSSEDFKINVRSLDELAPATFESTAETIGKQARSEENKSESGPTVAPSRHLWEQPQRNEEEDEVEEELYHSDFESASLPDQSAYQVSEDVQGTDDEEAVLSEVNTEGFTTSHRNTVDDYWVSEHSRSLSWSSDSKLSVSGRTSSEWTRMPAADREAFKEAAVQTLDEHPAHNLWFAPAGVTPTYLLSTPVITHTLRAETIEALSSFNPTLFTLSEMLKQQLSAITSSIQNSQQLHRRLLQGLEPPDYRYTTLEDVQQRMKRQRTLTMEALDAEL